MRGTRLTGFDAPGGETVLQQAALLCVWIGQCEQGGMVGQADVYSHK